MNKKLLNKVKKAILRQPKRLRMGVGLWSTGSSDLLTHNDLPECGTIGCIAGWALLLHNTAKTHKSYNQTAKVLYNDWTAMADAAKKLLRLNADEANALFYSYHWPSIFFKDHEEARQRGDYTKAAEVTAARIDYLIKHKI